MKEEIRVWKKDNNTIRQTLFLCDCGGELRNIGQAGCSHNDEWSNFFQCKSCKDMHISESYQEENPLTSVLIAHEWKEEKDLPALDSLEK